MTWMLLKWMQLYRAVPLLVLVFLVTRCCCETGVRPKPPNYVILTAARSASTMMCRVVDDHHDAACYAEPLNPAIFDKSLPTIAKMAGGTLDLDEAKKRVIASEREQLALPPHWNVSSLEQRHTRKTRLQNRNRNSRWPMDPSSERNNGQDNEVQDIHVDKLVTPFDPVKWLLTEQLPQRTGLCHLSGENHRFRSCATDAERSRHHQLVKGFKVLYAQPYIPEILELCKQHDLSVIHLIRASSYRRAISHMIARQTQVWLVTSGTRLDQARQTFSNLTLDIDRDRLKQIMDAHQHEMARWTKYLSDNNIRHKTIFYEEIEMRRRYLPKSEVFREVYEFLGLDPSRVQGELADVAYSKMFNYSRLIGNIAELRRDYPFETCGLEYGSPFE